MRTIAALCLLFAVACNGPAPTDAGGSDVGAPDDGGADDGGGDGGLASDGGADAGGLDADITDVGATDVGTDAPPAPEPVTVIVTDDAAPHPGARVAFFGPDGELVATAVTGSDGTASHLLEDGGTVVVVPVVAAGDVQTFAWLGVEPGDVLPVVRRSEPSSVTVETAFALPAVAGAVRWQLDTECGVVNGFVSPVPLDVPDDCTSSDIVVTYYDAASEPLATLSALDVAITPGTDVDLTGASVRVVRPTTVELVDLPSETLFASIEARGRFGAIDAAMSLSATTTTGGTASATGPLPDVTGGGVSWQRARIVAFGGTLFVERAGGAASRMRYGEIAMPVISSVGYAPAIRQMSFTTAGGGTVAAEATFLRLEGGEVGDRRQWLVFAPALDVITLPTLPAEMADAELPADATPLFDVYRLAGPSSVGHMRGAIFTLRSASDLLEGEGDLVYTFVSTRS